ncbi:unnamed protein product, partial [Pleuronectes platessa]
GPAEGPMPPGLPLTPHYLPGPNVNRGSSPQTMSAGKRGKEMSQGSLTTKVRPPDLQGWSHWASLSVSPRNPSTAPLHMGDAGQMRIWSATLRTPRGCWGCRTGALDKGPLTTSMVQGHLCGSDRRGHRRSEFTNQTPRPRSQETLPDGLMRWLMDIIKELGRTSEGLIAPDHGCDELQNPHHYCNLLPNVSIAALPNLIPASSYFSASSSSSSSWSSSPSSSPPPRPDANLRPAPVLFDEYG